MFRKAQLKFFAIISSILLAIFIAVLGSVNLIMKAVMERQSRNVLRQIAEGVEYDDSTSTFTFVHPDHEPFKPDEMIPPRPETATTTVTSTSTATTTTTVTTTVTITETHEETTVQADPEPETWDEPGTVPEETKHESPPAEPDTPPTDTQPPATSPASEPPSDYPWENDRPPDWGWQPPPGDHDWGDYDHPQYGPPGRFDPFRQKDQQGNDYYDDGSQDGFSGTFSESSAVGRIMPLENTSAVPEKMGTAKKDGASPKGERPGAEPVPRSLGTIDFFIIMSDNNGKYLAVLNNDELRQETAQKYISKILESKAETGTLNQYQFYQLRKDNGTLMVLTDKSAEIDMLNKLIRTTITIGAAAFLLLSVAAFFLSIQIVKPLKTAFEKQKQFVSDASHELKTPVTVISANADVLSGEIGENKWLTYIKSQTERMNVLVNDLLNLTRLENNTADFIRVDFNLSKAVVNTALPFECQAFETNKKFIVDVDEDIMINGSEKHIKQMAAIFIDNALKYSNDGGTVRVTLKNAGDKKIFTVFNTGKGIRESEKDKIFERFYRSDESRNRSTGGYGLGLAIAKSIIDKHKFKISVDTREGESISFVVTM